MPEKTLGERRVRSDFNPSSNDEVMMLKHKAAELINQIDLIQLKPVENPSAPEPSINGEIRRLKALAMTSAEEAAMWAVKAATF